MNDLKFLLEADMKKLNELKKELNEHAEKIEEIRREKDRLYFFLNHSLNLANNENKKIEEREQRQRQQEEERSQGNRQEEEQNECHECDDCKKEREELEQQEQRKKDYKRRLYVFGGFYFEPVNLFFPDHDEIIFLRDTGESELIEKKITGYKKLFSKYYGELIQSRENIEYYELTFQNKNIWGHPEFTNGNNPKLSKTININQKFKFIFLKTHEAIRNILNVNKGDAFYSHYFKSGIFYETINPNILNVYIPCNTKREFMEDLEFNPIFNKFKLIRADCMGKRQECDECAGENFAELWGEFRRVSIESHRP